MRRRWSIEHDFANAAAAHARCFTFVATTVAIKEHPAAALPLAPGQTWRKRLSGVIIRTV
jgi:hypothetical protein